MISFANAKINLGLQVLSRRPDGYHDLETVFYPVPLYDAVEVVEAENLALYCSGIKIEGESMENLCLKAYQLLKEDFDLPPVHIYLHKVIPTGAGLGGGSSDAAQVLKNLNILFGLQISDLILVSYARMLGADCPFFMVGKPVFATGIGDEMEEIDLNLAGFRMAIMAPEIHISTAEAFRHVNPNLQGKNLYKHINDDVTTWKDTVFNDFETSVFQKYPLLAAMKEDLYGQGALYASLSGSGSCIYGLFAADQKLKDFPYSDRFATAKSFLLEL